MAAIKDYFTKGDRLAAYLGFTLEEVAEGYAKASMEVQPFHLNAVNMVHGATTFALADFAFAAACNACGTVAIAINAAVTFIKAAVDGVLVAEAREVSANPRLSTYNVEVRNGDGELIATFQGLAYRKKDPIIPSTAG
ncbi:MAG: PaaI family thioesterase [Phycisphaerae bacterium]|nr:PaaI family thioesterase [Phycisphaerae bacterium]